MKESSFDVTQMLESKYFLIDASLKYLMIKASYLVAISDGVNVSSPIAFMTFNLYSLDFNKEIAFIIFFCILNSF